MLPDDLPETLERLIDLGRTPDVNIRPVLLRVLVDLFVGKPTHTAEALRHFEEIVSRLIDEADHEVRLIVAGKLAGHPQTPKALLNRLIAERGDVAVAVLSRAGLDPQALQAAATLGTVEMAKAVAGRSDLNGATIRTLAERPEPAVLATLAGNTALPLEGGIYRYLVRRAREHEQAAERLLGRDVDPIAHMALFMSASRDQRAAILTALRRHDLGLPRSAPVAGGPDACDRIARLALLPGMEGLDLILCHTLDLPAPLAEQIIEDPGGEPLAIALSALGASPELAARLFILGPPVIGRVYATVKFLVGIVETVSPGAARRLIDSVRGESVAVVPRARLAQSGERTHTQTQTRAPAEQAPAIRKAS